MILRRIMLPLVRNGVIVVMLTNFIAAWGEWLLANTLTNDQDKRTLTVVLASANAGFGSGCGRRWRRCSWSRSCPA